MKLTLDSLINGGGFVGGPVEQTIEWTANGQTYTGEMWFRPLSYQAAASEVALYRKDMTDDQLQAERMIQYILLSVCNEDGSPFFTRSDLTGYKDDGTPVMIKNADGKKVERGPLHPALINAMFIKISELSGLGKS